MRCAKNTGNPEQQRGRRRACYSDRQPRWNSATSWASSKRGRAALKHLGIDQWQGDNPNEDLIRADIVAGHTMVAVQDGALLGTLAFFDTIEPDYARVISGRWLSDELTARITAPSSIANAGIEADSPERGDAMASDLWTVHVCHFAPRSGSRRRRPTRSWHLHDSEFD